MPRLKTVGVKQLKNELSSFLRDVKSGTRVLITDRGEVVAELRKPVELAGVSSSASTLLLQWREQGILVSHRTSSKRPETSGVELPEGTSQGILDWVRGK